MWESKGPRLTTATTPYVQRPRIDKQKITPAIYIYIYIYKSYSNMEAAN